MLGEHSAWCKVQLFEPAARIPLLIRSPDHPASHGKRARTFAESIDLLPTLASLVGLHSSLPTNGSDGVSLVAAFNNSSQMIKHAAVTQVPRCLLPSPAPSWEDNICGGRGWDGDLFNFTAMGYSVRTAEWRLTLWMPWDAAIEAVDWNTARPIGIELYNHTG